ncbi:MAG: hypothetical protein KatS3mg103_1093 [Phycisphaerales bacterium]|nr:MAG: hypothetical protein KatS3mg103_1093 [Phycisphaerales bacterium]
MTDNPYVQPAGVAVEADAFEPRVSAMAVASLVVSLLGLVACCVPGIGPLGLLLGVVALLMINASGGRKSGTGLAVAGIIIGLLAGVVNLGFIWGMAWGGKQWAEMGVVLVEIDDGDLPAVQGRLVSAQSQALTAERLEAFARSVRDDYGAQGEPPKALLDALSLIVEVGPSMQAAQAEAQKVYPPNDYGVIPLAMRYERGPVLFMLVVPKSGQASGVAYTNIGYLNRSGDLVWLLPTGAGGSGGSGQGAGSAPGAGEGGGSSDAADRPSGDDPGGGG